MKLVKMWQYQWWALLLLFSFYQHLIAYFLGVILRCYSLYSWYYWLLCSLLVNPLLLSVDKFFFFFLLKRMTLRYFSSRKRNSQILLLWKYGCQHELCDQIHDHLFLPVALCVWINPGNLKYYDYHPLWLQNKFKIYEFFKNSI